MTATQASHRSMPRPATTPPPRPSLREGQAAGGPTSPVASGSPSLARSSSPQPPVRWARWWTRPPRMGRPTTRGRSPGTMEHRIPLLARATVHPSTTLAIQTDPGAFASLHGGRQPGRASNRALQRSPDGHADDHDGHLRRDRHADDDQRTHDAIPSARQNPPAARAIAGSGENSWRTSGVGRLRSVDLCLASHRRTGPGPSGFSSHPAGVRRPRAHATCSARTSAPSAGSPKCHGGLV